MCSWGIFFKSPNLKQKENCHNGWIDAAGLDESKVALASWGRKKVAATPAL